MDLKRIKPGKRVGYIVKGKTGKGRVESIHEGKTGSWVTISDPKRGVSVAVRPSQVSAA